MEKQFTVIVKSEEDGFTALCPEMDIASQGDTIEDAKKNLQEALELFFECASPEEIKTCLQNECYIARVDVDVE